MMKREPDNRQFGVEPVIYTDETEELDLRAWLQVLIKRRKILFACVGAAVFFALVFVFKATPKYKAAGTLMIEEESSRILSIEDEFGYRQSRADIRFFNTQLELLKTNALVERVARKLDLLNHPLFSAKNSDAEKTAKPANPYSLLVKDLQRNLDVSPVRDTRLVEVSYTSPDPAFSSLLVNTLSQEFVDFYIEKKYQTTQQASKFLEEQIADLRERLSVKEAELQEYSKEKDLYFLSEQESASVGKFADVNAAYTQAQIERIKAESNYRQLRNLKVDALPQFINNAILQDLKTEYVKLKNDYEEKRKIFKPDYPDMVQLLGRLDSMRAELENEITKAVDAAETEFRTALNKELSLKQLLDQQKEEVALMNSNAIIYNNLKIEVENNRKLLISLEERQKETLVSARLGELKTSNISIINPAEPPLNPVYPKKKLTLILALIVGLFIGGGLCFVLDYLDNTVKGPEDVERLARLPSLGVIPYLPHDGQRKFRHRGSYYRNRHGGDGKEVKNIELVNHLFPEFSLSEDYRTVRTSILLSSAGRSPKSIVVTSALPKDGKTVTVSNLAVAFAQLKKKVLVVDSDMRKPKQQQIFKVQAAAGLSSYLTGKASLYDCIHETNIQGVSLIPCGPVPPNPAELLDSRPMQELVDAVKGRFDVVLFDTPPVLAVVDSVIVSAMVEATILVVYPGKTKEDTFCNAVEELRKGNIKIIGTVFNGMSLEKNGYYTGRYYRGYYWSNTEEGRDEEQKRVKIVIKGSSRPRVNGSD